jgi:site-specific recombinase XerC
LIQAWAKSHSPRRDRGKDQAGRHVDSFPHFQWLRHAGLRPGSATHWPERSENIHMIQELLCHNAIRTTMIHTHKLNCGPFAIRLATSAAQPPHSNPF